MNEALARADSIMHCAVEGVVSAPPASPQDGQSWLIDSAPSGEFTGHSDEIVSRQEGQWIYVVPADGMRVYDRTTGQDRRYAGGWTTAGPVTSPVGGNRSDDEARVAINEIIDALRASGILPAS